MEMANKEWVAILMVDRRECSPETETMREVKCMEVSRVLVAHSKWLQAVILDSLLHLRNNNSESLEWNKMAVRVGK